jgi:serine/threonine-protein kinase
MTKMEMEGTLLGERYLLSGETGSGSAGRVFRAVDLRTAGPVAVKLLHPALAADPGFRQRLRDAARRAAAISSPRVVHIVDVGEHNGIPFLVLEYVAGETLDTYLRQVHATSVDDALSIGL